MLHFARIETATNCNKMPGVETSLYAHSYARSVPRQATASQVTTSAPCRTQSGGGRAASCWSLRAKSEGESMRRCSPASRPTPAAGSPNRRPLGLDPGSAPTTITTIRAAHARQTPQADRLTRGATTGKSY
jgi:hypothetical protein